MTPAKAPLDITNIRMVVFDIDGTIADTANLVPNKQRRKPDDILKLLNPSAVDSELLRIKNIRRMTSNFNRCGIRVAVISSAPAAYVGTMCFLMGVEADTIIASNNVPGLTTKADRLRWLASTPRHEEFGTAFSIKDLLYVGDLPEDAVAAQGAGCLYEDIETYLNNAEQVSKLSRLETLCEDFVSGTLPAANEKLEWQLEFLHGITESYYGIDMSIPEAIMDPDGIPGIFNPFEPNSPIQRPLLDPSFITREEYQNNRDLKCKLFEALASNSPAQLQRFYETNSHLSKIRTFAHLKYWNTRLGQDLWKSIKDWHSMRSGPEVNLLNLEFVALFMASSIWIQHNLGNSSLAKPAIVPLPSSPYSSSSPARVSNRLARRVSQLTELPFVEIFEKQGDEILFLKGSELDLESVILIDDQLTMGTTAEKCLAKIAGHIKNIELRVWTSKNFTADSPEMLISNPIVKEIDFKVFETSRVEIEKQVPAPGQRVLARGFGLGRITKVDSGWMLIEFKGFGTYRYSIDRNNLEFLD